MKNLFAFLMIACMLTLGISNVVFAQNEPSVPDTVQADTTNSVDDTTATAVEVADDVAATLDPAETEEPGFHQVLKDQFIAGGWQFMSLVLACLTPEKPAALSIILMITPP